MTFGRIPARLDAHVQRGYPFRASIKMRDGSPFPASVEVRFDSGETWPATISGDSASWDVPAATVDERPRGERFELVFDGDVVWASGRAVEDSVGGFGGQGSVLVVPTGEGGSVLTSPAIKGDQGDKGDKGDKGDQGAPGGSDAATAGWIETGTQTRSALQTVLDAEVQPLVADAIADDDTPVLAAAAAAETAVGNWLEGGRPVTPTATTFFDLSANLYDKATRTDGYVYSAGAATPTTNASYTISDWIPVSPSTAYTYSGNILRVTYFDAAKTYVGYQNQTTTTYTATTPSGARFARLSIQVDSVNTAMMNVGATALPYEPGGNEAVTLLPSVLPAITPEATTFFDASANLFDASAVTQGMIYASGASTPTANANYTISDWIPVTSSTAYTYSCEPGRLIARVTYFDAAKVYVGSQNFPSMPWTASTPASARWARLSIQVDALPSAMMNAGTVALPYQAGATGYEPKIVRSAIPVPPVCDTNLSGTFTTNRTYPDMATVLPSTTPQDIYDLYDALVTAHPTYVTRQQIGAEASASIPIYAYTFTPDLPPHSGGVAGTKPELYKAILVSGTHGGEIPNLWTTYHLMENLCNQWGDDDLLAALRFNVQFVVVPVANPSGVRDQTRKNANGVDLARNWPTDWVQGAPTDVTYGGAAPLSEPETVAMKSVLDAHPDAHIVIDFHNYGGTSTEFLWSTPANQLTVDVCSAHIRRMDRAWRASSPGTLDPDAWVGSLGIVPPGSLGREAVARGHLVAATYENALASPGGAWYDSTTMTWAYEAWVNFILMCLHNI